VGTAKKNRNEMLSVVLEKESARPGIDSERVAKLQYRNDDLPY